MSDGLAMTYVAFSSPFARRYGSDDVCAIWSEEHKHRRWRRSRRRPGQG